VPRSNRNPSRSLAVVVMAAGKGKRLKSTTPKVLHPVCGRPILWHVVRAAVGARPDRLLVVVHHGKGEVEEAVRSWSFSPEAELVDQGEPLGTAHAVMVAEGAVGDASEVIVLSGDEPLVTTQQVRDLLRPLRRRDVAAVVQTTVLDDALGFARVIRDERGELVRLAEGDKATRAELSIHEVATSNYAFRRSDLFAALPLVDRENRQHEYYLPDVLGILRDKGERVAVVEVDSGGSVGSNSRAELAHSASVMRARINAAHMDGGVTLIDPDRTYIDAEVRIGPDTVIHPLTFLEGSTRVGSRCVIGPTTRITDSKVGDGSKVQFSVLVDAKVGRDVSVGPFAYLRPGAEFDDGAKAGSFVEIKKSRVGKGSKVPHLAYVGDTTIGRNVNIGAATITVNYDGWDKHQTVIEDEVLIGSDTMLVAPVRVGKGAMTGAGSVITKDVPAGALAIERSEQRMIEGFRKRKEDEKARRRARGRRGGH
jgi:bifunctional UDP-N-acetylglucosamine pyrophosphorylase / glucosamine-1-phosphate N-acetyltransferase